MNGFRHAIGMRQQLFPQSRIQQQQQRDLFTKSTFGVLMLQPASLIHTT